MTRRPDEVPRGTGVLVNDLAVYFRNRELVLRAMQMAGVEMPPIDRRLSNRGSRRPLTYRQTVLVMRCCYQLVGKRLERDPRELAHYLGQIQVGIAGEKPERFRPPRWRESPQETPETTSGHSGEDDEP